MAVSNPNSLRTTTPSGPAAHVQNDGEENDREITIFIQVLVKYLQAKYTTMYAEAKKVILNCLKKNHDNVPGYSSLSASLLSHLRKLVGGSFWKEAEMYFVKYLRDKKGMSLFQAERIKGQVAIRAAFAYRDLRQREQKKRFALSNPQHCTAHTQQQQEKKKLRRENSHISSCSLSSSSSSERRKSVRFDRVNIREYDVTVGDNPSCSSGVPITLSWKYKVHEGIPLDQYEMQNTTSRGNAIQLNAGDRYAMLTKNGVPDSEIIEAHEECQRVQKERRETINTLKKEE